MLFKFLEHKYQKVKVLAAIVLLCLLTTLNSEAQKHTSKNDVYVDKNGVMRWGQNHKEVHGFGVNYTAPFAHAYRSAKRMNIDIKKAIDDDVYHFSRLGFDLFRIHVWDTEISDTLGNLINNAHLDAFDYLLKKLKEKHINYVLTPIAYWGNGWPEPDENTPGFSHKYGKDKSLTNPKAIKAQKKYLHQFLNHVNPYTGVAYKDDPNIIAFEISNEPHHRGDSAAVTKFVKGMLNAMRKTGTKKPIFYNVSHAIYFADAYFKAGINGGTFQWYPTGLGYQQELSGNLLPNVNDYNIPFENTIKKYHGAKLVYEFDAADVGKSYIYPAIARSFRTAGIQIATHFAYDPTFLASSNTEYNTHYMNLAYAPQKALSLMIASKVFHQIPMYKDFGLYPENMKFDAFKVDYKNALAQFNADNSFIYTNNTNSNPVNETDLKQIAGFGNSKLVQYQGAGAYFLDKINDGLWRLEVMPDAIWVADPFGRNSPNKPVGVIKWNAWPMTIKLNDLSSNFEISAINDGNSFLPQVDKSTFIIKPGTYMLSKKGVSKTWLPIDVWKDQILKDFYAPQSNVTKIYLKHIPVKEATAQTDLTVEMQLVASQNPTDVSLWVYSGYRTEKIKMEMSRAYHYAAKIPAAMVKEGYLKYQIVVKDTLETMTFPAAKEGTPFAWDFYDRSTYEVRVVSATNPIYLFNAKTDADLLVKSWRKSFKLIPTKNDDEAEYDMNIEKLFVVDNENINAKPRYDYSFKQFIIDKIKGRKSDLSLKEKLVFYGHALNNKPCKLQVAFVLKNGASFGTILDMGVGTKAYKIDLRDLKPVKTVTLPRPYPGFLPYYLKHNITSEFDINNIESIQFSIGLGIPESQIQDKHGIGIISMWLE